MSWIKSSFCDSTACIEAQFIKSSFCADRQCLEAAYIKSSLSGIENCVEAAYIKSSQSVTNGTCVEAASCNCSGVGQVLVRDSKNPDGLVLSVTRQTWLNFLDGIKNGDFAAV